MSKYVKFSHCPVAPLDYLWRNIDGNDKEIETINNVSSSVFIFNWFNMYCPPDDTLSWSSPKVNLLSVSPVFSPVLLLSLLTPFFTHPNLCALLHLLSTSSVALDHWILHLLHLPINSLKSSSFYLDCCKSLSCALPLKRYCWMPLSVPELQPSTSRFQPSPSPRPSSTFQPS